MMFDYIKHFHLYCRDTGLDIRLSFEMPQGYETANGTFDIKTKTVFINAEYLNEAPDYEKAFFLFHELRHASQYLCPDRFNNAINRSIQYIIMYNGTCYKWIGGKYIECKLDGGEEYFTNLYLDQPHEVDANTFAYEQVKNCLGNSEELRRLYDVWMPCHPVSDEIYDEVFSMIDRKTKS